MAFCLILLSHKHPCFAIFRSCFSNSLASLSPLQTASHQALSLAFDLIYFAIADLVEMDLLPVELVIQICSYFCFHCQNPGVFPTSDLPQLRHDKKLLGRLCRVSKRMRSIAQPILFHYYATGNLPQLIANSDINPRRFPSNEDKLCAFLRSIIDRPDLAACVRCLQVAQPHGMFFTDTLQAIFLLQLGQTENITMPDAISHKISSLENLVALGNRGTRTVAEDLLFFLAGRMESLVVTRDSFRTLTTPMLSLKTLSLQSLQFEHDIQEIAPLLAATPNLQTLYAVDWINPGSSIFNFEVPLLKLRKLVLGHVPHHDLRKLLRCCTGLEDLEYYGTIGTILRDITDIWSTSKLMEALVPVQKSLKRFVYAHVDRDFLYSDDIDDFDEDEPLAYEDRFSVGGFETALCFTEFDKLQELAIEYAAFDCRSDDSEDPNKIVNLLPPSIRTLQLMYVYRGLTEPLLQLARETPTKFPDLQCVKIGLVEIVQPVEIEGISRMRGLEAAFARVNVEVQWSKDKTIAHPETLVPGSYATSILYPVPTIGFQNSGWQERRIPQNR